MEEWKKIANKFNTTSICHNRDFSTLKTLWENLKYEGNLVISTETQNWKETGKPTQC